MKRGLLLTAAVGLLLGGWNAAEARPTLVEATPTLCDAIVPATDHELGWGPVGGPASGGPSVFSAVEDIGSTATITNTVPCPATNLGLLPETLVVITNFTGLSWEDLWFVSDADAATLTNEDALIAEVAPLSGSIGQGFRIDTLGVNTPLVSESIAPNLIFEPGESWTFIVQDWFAPGVVSFGSLGVAGVSSPIPGSNASIIARQVQVPEPASLVLLGLGVAAVGLARRRRRT